MVVAGCREEALTLISEDEFDLIICDVKIPPTADSADVDERHGFAVQAKARAQCPGTPTIFLTGFAPDIDVRRQLSRGGVASIFTLGNYPLSQLMEKDEVEELERLVSELAGAEIALNTACSVTPTSSADQMLTRAVQMYAHKTGHTSASAVSTSGLSGARTCRVHLTSKTGAPASIFIKVLGWEDAEAEYERFNRFVPNRLAPGLFAPSLPPLNTGLRKQTALVSTLASSGSVSLFQQMIADPTGAAATIDHLAGALAAWRTNPTVQQVELGALRRPCVSG